MSTKTHSLALKSSGKHPRKLDEVITPVGGGDVLMPMVLEWTHMGVMVNCPHTFGHIVYMQERFFFVKININL